MVQFTDEEKARITAMVVQLQQQTGGVSDRKFAVKLGISNATLSYIKNEETRSRVGDSTWLTLAQAVNFTRNADDVWHFAETKVSKYLFTQFAAAQQFGATAMMADEPGIGKTFCMKEYARTHADVMCIDCSVSNTKASFIRAIAKAVGVTGKGRLQEVLDSAIYAVKLMDKPLFIFDEAGDLENGALLQLKKLYNALEGRCGIYLLGSDGFKSKIQRGVEYDKLGYTEIYSRFDCNFKKALSSNIMEQADEMKQMAAAVMKANGLSDAELADALANCTDPRRGRCDLRRAEREVLKARRKRARINA